MVLIGAITYIRGILLFITQILGGIIAAALVNALFTGDLNVSTTLNDTTTIAQGVIIEMLLTAQLVFTIFMLAAEKHQGNFVAPVGIGISLFVAELVGVFCPFCPFSLNSDNPNRNPNRRLLDRRLPQPRPLLRPRGRDQAVRIHAVDLLGRTPRWGGLRCAVV